MYFAISLIAQGHDQLDVRTVGLREHGDPEALVRGVQSVAVEREAKRNGLDGEIATDDRESWNGAARLEHEWLATSHLLLEDCGSHLGYGRIPRRHKRVGALPQRTGGHNRA